MTDQTKVQVNGQEFDRDAVANLMDNDLREELHCLHWTSEQAFVDAYCTAHRRKFGESFIIS